MHDLSKRYSGRYNGYLGIAIEVPYLQPWGRRQGRWFRHHLLYSEQFQSLSKRKTAFPLPDGEKLAAYVMAASWDYWSAWPLFQYMIKELPKTEYLGQKLSTENSYQYGPICIDKGYRGTEVLPKIFEHSKMQMRKRYPILITFINQINSRSYYAHTKSWSGPDQKALSLITIITICWAMRRRRKFPVCNPVSAGLLKE